MKKNRQKSDERRFLSVLLWNHKKRIFAIIGLLLIVAGFNAVLPQLSIAIIDDGFTMQNISVIVKCSILIFTINALITAICLCVEKIRLAGYNAIQTELKEKSVQKLNTIRIDFYSEQSATAIFQQLDEDITAVSGCFSSEILLSFAQIAISLVLFPVLFSISWKLTIILIIAIPINMLKSVFLSKKAYRYSKNRVQATKDYSQWISEVILGAQIIRCFVPIKTLQTTFRAKQNQVVKTQYKHALFQETVVRLEGLFIEILLMCFYIVGGYYVVGGELSLGQFIAFQTYSLSMLNIIGEFLNVIYGYSMLKPSIERFIDFDKGESEMAGSKSAQNIRADIIIDNLSFSYSDQENLLNGVSLVFPYGKKIGICGGNGTGKTTLINLLLRFYTPTEGSIRIGNDSITDYKIDEYRHLFSVAPQNPFLFCDSIRNNICLYRDVDEEELFRIIELVGLNELVKEKTLDYCVGQDGCELSGGQRQRISIARTLVKHSPYVILDEPEANLDSDFRPVLYHILAECYKNRTVIVITHDKELLKQMDCQYTLAKESHENCNNR